MNKHNQNIAILLAILAAALYAISTPISKVMLQVVPPTMVAAFLYLGAGIGVGTMMVIRYERKRPSSEECLHRRDIPYTLKTGSPMVNAKVRDLPTIEQVPYIISESFITLPLLPARRLTGTDYQHVTANLGNIWETL